MLKKWNLIVFYLHSFVPVLFKCILGRFPEYITLPAAPAGIQTPVFMVMCKYCETPKNGEPLDLDIDFLDAYIEGRYIIMKNEGHTFESGFDIWWKINYCPMCGRQLVPYPRI
jgi:hypothetical protein